MNIRNGRELKHFAAERLDNSQNVRKILLIYSGLALGLSGLVTVVNYLLGLQMDGLTGLSNLGKRNMLSSFQSLTPIALSLFSMCLDVGFLAVMMRTARGQYVSEQTLRLGFDRFWVLLRCSLFKSLMYTGVLFVSVYLGIMLFMLSPLSDPAIEVLTPYLSEMSVLNGELVLDDAAYAQFSQAVWPAYLICGVLALACAGPMWYSYRMVNYIIVDKPGIGAMAALRESKQMMRRNRLSLLKLDVSLWWYYLGLLVAQVICYGDMILPLLGIPLPGNSDVWYFVFLAAYLLTLFAVYYFLRGRAEVTYALAYDSIKPEEKKDSGVVLGNIFQM